MCILFNEVLLKNTTAFACVFFLKKCLHVHVTCGSILAELCVSCRATNTQNLVYNVYRHLDLTIVMASTY